MYISPPLVLLITCFIDRARALDSRAPARVAVTDNILELSVIPASSNHHPPSSKHLARRRNAQNAKRDWRRQTPKVQEDLMGLGGRIYLTNATVGGKPYALVIDTGSSDTWITSANFQCEDPTTSQIKANSFCGFGTPYDENGSKTLKHLNYAFSVRYSGGEYLSGTLGEEEVGIGGLSSGKGPIAKFKQTMGVVESGYWIGDGISSGLIGLGLPALASGVGTGALNYTSFVFTLFKNASIPALMSIALNRPTANNPKAGGLIAFGGIPNIPLESDFVTVPIQPVFTSMYAFYSIQIDGFNITAPPSSPRRKPRIFKPKAPKKPSGKSRNNNKRQRQKFPDNKVSMVVDSGTSLAYFPQDVVEYIASLFSPPATYTESTDLWVVNCTARAPRVGVIIGGKSFFIHEEDLMNRVPESVGGPSAGVGAGQCVLATQGAEEGGYLLGDSWLKNVLVVFDLEKGTDFGPGGSDRDGNGGGSLRIAARETY